MLTAMIGEEAELGLLKRLILEKSDGTPFFIEEIVQSLFDRGILRRNGKVVLTKPLTKIEIPAVRAGAGARRRAP